MRPHSGPALYMEQISAQPPMQRLPSNCQVIIQGCNTKCLTLPLPIKLKFSYLLMSTCHSIRSHSVLKNVLTKLENSYQTYVNTYKTHTKATHHRGTGQPLEKDLNPQDQDIDIPIDYQHDNIDDFENVENENHTQLRDLTNKVDHLQHKIDVTEGQPTEAINCLECELCRLSLALHQHCQNL